MQQPENTTVEESETAIFKCVLSNASFQLIWLINNSAADFTIYQRQGVVIRWINSTASNLHIPGDRNNNHTQVQCIAVLYQDSVLVDHELSEIVLLIVLLSNHNGNKN